MHIKPILAILAVSLCLVSPGLSLGQAVWRSDFRSGKIGGWVGYGGDSVCKVVRDPTDKKRALLTSFSDKSSVAWAHRGIRIDFPGKGISRNTFKYIQFDYWIDQPVKALGYFLQDADDNMWRVFTGPVATRKWARSVVPESAFKFGWGKKPPGNRSAKIVRLYLFVETPKVNTGGRFKLFVDNVLLSNKRPERPPHKPLATGPVNARKRYLLLDNRLIDRKENVRLSVGRVKKHPANPLFGQELPWEQFIHHMYGNVLFDRKDRLYKLWYFTTISGPPQQTDWSRYVTPGPQAPREKRLGNCATLYAFSRDGLKWKKPSLDVYTYQGKPTNIVVWGTHGTGIFKDKAAADPRRRYKRIAGRHPHGTLDAAFSADGIHWSKRFPIAKARGDTHNNALWVPELKKYVAFTRAYPPPGNRTVLRLESKDFVHWSKPIEVLRGPMEAQTYSMPVFRYADIYLGLPAIYHTQGKLHGRVTTELAWSPDTRRWFRIDEGQPLIPLSKKKGDVDWGCIYAFASPIVHSDGIRIYYSGQKKTHDWNPGWLCLATLRRDRWAGYTPVKTTRPGVIVTRPILANGSRLWVTADCRKGGSVKVTLLTTTGQPIRRGTTLTTDSTETNVAKLGKHIGKRVRIRFELRSGQLYSFGFR